MTLKLAFLPFFLFLFLRVVSGEIFPDPSNPLVSYEEEYSAFEASELLNFKTSEGKNRAKRFVYLNSDTFMAVALLVGVPVSLILPSLSNIFNKWRRRRSIDDIEEFQSFPQEDINNPELDRISTYFQLVDVRF